MVQVGLSPIVSKWFVEFFLFKWGIKIINLTSILQYHELNKSIVDFKPNKLNYEFQIK